MILQNYSKIVFGIIFGVILFLPITTFDFVDAFTVDIHEEITHNALSEIIKPDVLALMKEQHKAVDRLLPWDRQWDAEWHFDDCTFKQSTQNLQKQYDRTLTLLGNEQYTVAAVPWGALLHPTQDFYAHTNWIESGYGKLLVDKTLVTWKTLEPYQHVPDEGLLIIDGEDRKVPYKHRPLSVDDHSHIVTTGDGKKGLISGSAYVTDNCPSRATLYHWDDPVDRKGSNHASTTGSFPTFTPEDDPNYGTGLHKDSESRPLHNEAKFLAQEQTKHELCRLFSMVEDKYDEKGVKKLLENWVRNPYKLKDMCPSFTNPDDTCTVDADIPPYLRHIIHLWSQGKVSNQDLIGGMRYYMEKDIIKSEELKITCDEKEINIPKDKPKLCDSFESFKIPRIYDNSIPSNFDLPKVTLHPGESCNLIYPTAASNLGTSKYLHFWADATGDLKSWITPQHIDNPRVYYLQQDEIFRISVPDNQEPGEYQLTWDVECEGMPGKKSCRGIDLHIPVEIVKPCPENLQRQSIQLSAAWSILFGKAYGQDSLLEDPCPEETETSSTPVKVFIEQSCMEYTSERTGTFTWYLKYEDGTAVDPGYTVAVWGAWGPGTDQYLIENWPNVYHYPVTDNDGKIVTHTAVAFDEDQFSPVIQTPHYFEDKNLILSGPERSLKLDFYPSGSTDSCSEETVPVIRVTDTYVDYVEADGVYSYHYEATWHFESETGESLEGVAITIQEISELGESYYTRTIDENNNAGMWVDLTYSAAGTDVYTIQPDEYDISPGEDIHVSSTGYYLVYSHEWRYVTYDLDEYTIPLVENPRYILVSGEHDKLVVNYGP